MAAIPRALLSPVHCPRFAPWEKQNAVTDGIRNQGIPILPAAPGTAGIALVSHRGHWQLQEPVPSVKMHFSLLVCVWSVSGAGCVSSRPCHVNQTGSVGQFGHPQEHRFAQTPPKITLQGRVRALSVRAADLGAETRTEPSQPPLAAPNAEGSSCSELGTKSYFGALAQIPGRAEP